MISVAAGPATTRLSETRASSNFVYNAMQEVLSTDEWAARVSRLAELIAHKTEAIRQHAEAPDRLAIGQYEELRRRYLSELSELMHQYGIVIRFEDRTTDQAA